MGRADAGSLGSTPVHRWSTAVLALLVAVGVSLLDSVAVAAQTPGPAPGVAYGARRGEAEVRLVGLGETPTGEQLVMLDVRVECDGFEPQARLVGVVEEEGRFEVEGSVSQPGTTDVITGEFDDIDGKVRSDGVVLEIDVEVEGEDNAGPTGRCEETQQWRLRPRRSDGASRIDGAVPSEATELATNGDALFTLVPSEGAGGEVARVDPATLQTTWTVDAPPDAELLASSGDAVWVLDGEGLELSRIGALSGDVEATIPLVAPDAAADVNVISPVLVATPTAAWVAIDETQAVYRVDAATNEVSAATVVGRVDALAPAGDGVFAITAAESGGDARLVHLGDRTDELGAVVIEDLPSGLAADAALVWTRSTDRLAQYDATTLQPNGLVSHPRLATGALTDLVLAYEPGAWTPSTRGLEAFDTQLAPTVMVPVVGTTATGLTAAEDAIYVLDAGYLIRVRD